MEQPWRLVRVTLWAVTRGDVSVIDVNAPYALFGPYSTRELAFSSVFQLIVTLVLELFVANIEEMPGGMISGFAIVIDIADEVAWFPEASLETATSECIAFVYAVVSRETEYAGTVSSTPMIVLSI